MIGIVSVGYLTSYLDSITLTKVINIFIAAVLLLIALFIFSRYFTRSIKKQIFRSSRGKLACWFASKGDDGVDL